MSETLNEGTSFIVSKDMAWSSPSPGVTRQILAHSPDMMVVRVVFEKGAVGAAHSHPHVQMSIVEEGVFDITINGETRQIGKGDGYLVEGGVVHGAVALEAGALLDVFTPRRDDFL